MLTSRVEQKRFHTEFWERNTKMRHQYKVANNGGDDYSVQKGGIPRTGSHAPIIWISRNSYFVHVVTVSLICLLLTFSIQMTDARYPEQFLESVEVCAANSFGTFGALAKKKIRLQNFPNNTVSVKITRWDDLYASFFNFRCRFQVMAPKNMGVMVVIQSMKLRSRRSRDYGNCRDYIQFQQDGGYKTSQICGSVEESDTAKIPERIIGPRRFYDPKGEMDVTFFTDQRDENTDIEDPISLHLVFTAYRECTPALMNSNVVRQCSTLRSHSCISSHLFCDGVINCGFNDEDFGADEKDCTAQSSRDLDVGDRTVSIYVFAITTVATLIIVVVFSLIVCCCLRKFAKKHSRNGDRHNHAYLQGDNPLQPHHRNPHERALAQDVIRLDLTGPSAPLQTTEPTPEKYPVVETDQPPPYDALFPTTKSSSSILLSNTKPSKK